MNFLSKGAGPAEQSCLAGITVLLAGDQTITMKMIEKHLRRRGCLLESARDISTVQELLPNEAAEQNVFDAVLVDITGDSTKAGGLVARIHLQTDAARTALILIADQRGSHDSPERQLPAAGYLLKPVRMEQLEKCLTKARKAPHSTSPFPDSALSAGVLPAESASDPLPAGTKAHASLAPGLRILLAEDNVLNQRVIRLMLQKMGHEVVVVDNGRDAVRAFGSTPLDLILLDGQMPEMDGLAAAAGIRQEERQAGTKQRIPIIAVTASAVSGDRESFLAAGMDDYISKPIQQKDLQQLLGRWGGMAGSPIPPSSIQNPD